jgi:FHA domain-containing protein
MAKLLVRFEQKVLKEIVLSHGVVTIGRLPDNLVQLDNPAVSGHHSRIYWTGEQYLVEDKESLNGTFVNNRRVSQSALQDGDVILVGKHTLEFRDSCVGESATRSVVDRTSHWQQQLDTTSPGKLEPTVVLGTKRAQEMMGAAAKMAAVSDSAIRSGSADGSAADTRVLPGHSVGSLTVVAGKTDQRHYLLSSDICAIGKSKMASVRMKGWFAPALAAVIQRREDGYVIAASRSDITVKVNSTEIAGQKELREGDLIEVARIKLTFGYQEL